MTSVLIKTDGSFTAIDPVNPSSGFSLEELFKVLSCDQVEVIAVDARPCSLVGRLKYPILICDMWSKNINHMASMIAGKIIVGDVIMTDSKNFR
jgi:hypothetical protein